MYICTFSFLSVSAVVVLVVVIGDDVLAEAICKEECFILYIIHVHVYTHIMYNNYYYY